jgi:hypothetical protein
MRQCRPADQVCVGDQTDVISRTFSLDWLRAAGVPQCEVRRYRGCFIARAVDAAGGVLGVFAPNGVRIRTGLPSEWAAQFAADCYLADQRG